MSVEQCKPMALILQNKKRGKAPIDAFAIQAIT
jgi:hypothetical protein